MTATTIFIRVNGAGELTDYSPCPQDESIWPGFIETDTKNEAYAAWYGYLDATRQSQLPAPGA